MEENLLLKQPTDPRLVSDLPDLPPGTEMDDFDTKKVEKETTSKMSTRRSSPSPKRKSSPQSRSRRSPSPARRNRYRYSPDRRGSRFDRRRSPPPRDRYRGRGGRRPHSSSRSRSRSVSPANRRAGRSRWSPKKKPKTPTPPPMQLPMSGVDANEMMMTTAPPPPNGQFGVMQVPAPPQIYGAESYASYGQAYPAFGQQQNTYPGNYNPAYGTQNNWTGHEAYQQGWIPSAVPNTNQMPPSQPPEASSFSNNGVNQTHTLPSVTNESSAHDAAVAQEAESQRDELKKQRSSYIQKNSVLKKELKMLKDQRKDLDSGNAPPSPTTKGFIDENEKLQSQIIKKIATIDNVIEMLTGVIGEEHVEQVHTASADTEIQNSVVGDKMDGTSKINPRLAKKAAQQKRTTSTSSNSSEGSHTSDSSSSSSSESSSSTDNEDNDAKTKTTTNLPGSGGANNVNIKQDDEDDDSSPERLKHKVMESMKSKQRTLSATALKDFPSLAEKIKTAPQPEQPRFNYAFYDPEMHWCKKCDVFPKTAKDYLKHLHSTEHMEKENASETPWHTNLVEDSFPTYENVQIKRMPIRGITFFAPATAWFCKLCSAWMGDLHCASVHLKSRQHSTKYTSFLERNPNFEMNWLADRQRVLNEKNLEAVASQITAVSTTAAEERENKKSKKSDEKASKKHKKSSDKKNKKKKKKQKKRKRAQESSSESSNSDSSSSEDAGEKQVKNKKRTPRIVSPIKDLDNPNPAASIRLAMRKAESSKTEINNDEPPPPPTISMTLANTTVKKPLGSWTLAQEGTGKLPNQPSVKNDNKSDDSIIQQWNSVQPVISDNEKKLLEQLKGKLKAPKPSSSDAKYSKDPKDSDKFDGSKSRESRLERSYRGKRSRSRSLTRSRSRGRDWRRARSRSLRRRSRSRGRRSRSRSRGRFSPVRGRRRRYSRSRSRRRRSQSRSRNRRGRRSRTRSRSGSRSGRGSPSAALTSASRIEKPIIPHSEFRPRVPEKDKEKEKKLNDSKEKKETKKVTKPASSSATSGKKLPFIGKMPVFKKQATGQTDTETAEATSIATDSTAVESIFMAQTAAGTTSSRPPPPTAEQIKMAMMEDVYGNAPPFHPDVNVMHQAMDYEDLMPDPVQFVNLMSQAPPAPPPPIEDANDEGDMLPPGIDENEMEEEKFVAQPAPVADESDAALPKDFEEALNIIFPGEKKEDDNEENSLTGREPAGETQIIVEQPVMQMNELFKDGIHLVSIEETSLMAMDEASQLSMNEPLVFNNKASNIIKKSVAENETSKLATDEPAINSNKNDDDKENVSIASSYEAEDAVAANKTQKNDQSHKLSRPPTPGASDSIPMPPPVTESHSNDSPTAPDLNLDDIPHPPPPLSESERQRRQEELDDLAMLGIDADDMAAQCM